MVVGIVAGTYSSIYVAAPLTEWIDSQMSKGGSTEDVKKRLRAGSRLRGGRSEPGLWAELSRFRVRLGRTVV